MGGSQQPIWSPISSQNRSRRHSSVSSVIIRWKNQHWFRSHDCITSYHKEAVGTSTSTDWGESFVAIKWHSCITILISFNAATNLHPHSHFCWHFLSTSIHMLMPHSICIVIICQWLTCCLFPRPSRPCCTLFQTLLQETGGIYLILVEIIAAKKRFTIKIHNMHSPPIVDHHYPNSSYIQSLLNENSLLVEPMLDPLHHCLQTSNIRQAWANAANVSKLMLIICAIKVTICCLKLWQMLSVGIGIYI